MSDKPRVRYEESEWPSPEEIDLALKTRLFKGEAPWPDWNPTKNVEQAVELARRITEDRTFNNVDLTYLRSMDNKMFREWEVRFTWMNRLAMEERDYRNVVEAYWAKAQEPALAICRAILNVLDGVQESEYGP